LNLTVDSRRAAPAAPPIMREGCAVKFASRLFFTLAILVFTQGAQVLGAMQNPTPLEQRAADVAALFRPQPGDYEKLFSKDFLRQVSAEQLTALFASTHAQLGRSVKTVLSMTRGAHAGKFDFVFEKGYVVPVEIAVDPAEPHLITGLLVGSPVRQSATLEDTVKEFKLLGGKVSFLLARLGPDGLSPLASYNPDETLAIGSAYKLYVLSALIRAVKAGKIGWADVVELKEQAVSLPSGVLQQWPAKSPLTIHTLAAMMISQSDNTASDQLLQVLGREDVEQLLAVTGHSRPERNIPFLSSLEMFKLKGDREGKAADRYLAMNVEERRKFLSGVVAGMDRKNLELMRLVKPTYVETIEWFASAYDLCRAMSWIWRQTEQGEAARARDILAINRPFAISDERWRYVGYKGGSDAGVLNMTFLLQSTKGDWYALSVGWNNTEATLDETRFFPLIERVLQLAP
jgi:Beta-lactamase enzyme family